MLRAESRRHGLLLVDILDAPDLPLFLPRRRDLVRLAGAEGDLAVAPLARGPVVAVAG